MLASQCQGHTAACHAAMQGMLASALCVSKLFLIAQLQGLLISTTNLDQDAMI